MLVGNEKAEAFRLFQISNLNFAEMTARSGGGNDLVQPGTRPTSSSTSSMTASSSTAAASGAVEATPSPAPISSSSPMAVRITNTGLGGDGFSRSMVRRYEMPFA